MKLTKEQTIIVSIITKTDKIYVCDKDGNKVKNPFYREEEKEINNHESKRTG